MSGRATPFAFLFQALTFLVLLAAAGVAQAERRAAVVIGNGEYPFAPLVNPKSDAKLIATTLTDLGFDVLLFYDVKKEATQNLKEAIRKQLVGADLALLYYAGHGVQSRGRNLLLPVDVRTGSAKQVIADALPLNDLIDIVKDDPVGVKVIVLDACRNNPLAREDGLDQGLAYTESGTGQVLIAFATGAGEVAYDGTGVNSPYSAALANALQKPGLDIYDTFRTVRGDVRQATGGSQIPWVTGSIETRFVFRPERAEAGSQAPLVVGDGSAVTIDEILWTFIQDSTDPGDFEQFAKVFPNSVHAAEARKKSETQVAAGETRALYVNGTLASTAVSAEPPADAAKEAAGADFVFQQAGERAVSETFRIWPSRLPDTERGMKSLVTQCDLYAADPNDPQRAVPGVSNGLVNVRDALRACAFSLAGDLSNPRLLFQFGRVLEIAGRYEWARYFYRLAGEQDYSAALVNLGYMARVGMGQDVDEAKALDYYLKAAAMGNLRARTNVGTAFIRGQGVLENPEEGVLWYRLAASSGWSNAITALGDSFRRGVGVNKDEAEAARLYAAAADAGQIDALANLGRATVQGAGVRKDVPSGLDMLLRATDQGNQYAPFYAAQIFLKGDSGLRKDAKRALGLFELSARRGYELAYLELAFGYRNGSFTGGKPDLRRAYFNASLAERFRANRANEARAAIGAKLGEKERKAVEADVETYVRQNGK